MILQLEKIFIKYDDLFIKAIFYSSNESILFETRTFKRIKIDELDVYKDADHIIYFGKTLSLKLETEKLNQRISIETYSNVDDVYIIDIREDCDSDEYFLLLSNKNIIRIYITDTFGGKIIEELKIYNQDETFYDWYLKATPLHEIDKTWELE